MSKVKLDLDLKKDQQGGYRMRNLDHYISLAELFKYPDTDVKEKIGMVHGILERDYPEASETMNHFVEFIRVTPVHEIEEVYAKTFHLQAICYLDLGYVMFGEDYKRGEFLVNMKNEQRIAGNDCGDELADNLSNVLTLLPLIKDEAVLEDLIGKILVPGIKKMRDEFKSAKMELRTKFLKKKHKAILEEHKRYGNVYQFALAALQEVLEKDFSEVAIHVQQVAPGFGNKFVTDCGTCSVSQNNVNSLKNNKS